MTSNHSTSVVSPATPETTFSIRVRHRGKSMQIDPGQIIRLQANGSYTMIHAEASAPLMTAKVLKTYVAQLQFFGFVRVNKTDLVNKQKIARMEDDGTVIMTDDYVSRISRRKKSLFRSLLSLIGLLLATSVVGQNVGIGTTSPAMPLTVRTADTTAGTHVVSLANGIIDSLYQLNATRGSSTGGAGSWVTAIGQAFNGGALSEALKFYRGTGNNNGSIGISTSGAERMRILSNGTVGIGTSSPDSAARLDIAGKLKLTDGTQAIGRFLRSDSTGLASWAQITTSTLLSEPVTPDYSCFREVNRTPSLTFPTYIASSQNYVYILNSGEGILKTYSLEDPAKPVETSLLNVGTGSGSIAISSDRGCIAKPNTNMVLVLDLSDPSHPSIMDGAPTDSTPVDALINGNLVYVVNLVASTFEIFDFSFLMPTVIGSIHVASNPDQVFISGNYAYITRLNSQTFTIIDISDPYNPFITFENGLPANNCSDLLVHNQYAYALIDYQGVYKLRTISVEDPQAPEVVTDLHLNFSPNRMDRVGNHIVVTSLLYNKLAIFSIDDPANPSLESEIALPNWPYPVTTQGLYAYVGSHLSGELVTVRLGCEQTISINSLSGESIASTMWETDGSSIFTSISKVSIGTTTSNAPLQLDNTLDNRKLVLFETNNNDHEFLGFGINPGMLRYQTANAGDDHVFFSGIDSTSSTELMRITGDGLVGIGTANPVSKLDVGGNVAIGSGYTGTYPAPPNGVIIEGKVGIGTFEPVSKLDLAGNVAIGANYAGNNLAPVNGALIEGNVGIGTTTPVSKMDLGGNLTIGQGYAGTNAAPVNGAIIEGNVGIGTTTPASKLDLEGNLAIGASYAGAFPAPVNGAIIEGNVGIGTIFPHAPLQFGNVASNRKIILSEAEDNDHRFRGFGNNPNELRYQVAYPSDNHVFYSGNTSSSSTELLRISGSGEVGIGTSTPHAPLQFGNTIANRKLVLYESVNNDHEYFGLGSNANMLRYQVAGAADNHAFFSGIDPITSKELMRITGGGFVGIGTTTPHALLQLANASANRKIVLSESGNNDHQFMGFGNQADMLRYQINSNVASHVFFVGSGPGASNELMRITGFGEVGIGTSTPHALLQLGNTTSNRKLVLYESTNNDHQYFGLGNNANSMRYQVAGASDNHVFYSGINSTTSKELLRITGSGFVGIGTNAPTFPLTVRTSTNTEGAKVASLATAIVDTLFQLNVTRGSTTNGTGAWMTAIGQAYNGGTITEGIKFFRGALTNDGAMAFTTNNTERIRITSSGAIGIGTSNPFSKLDVEGNLTVGAGYGGSNAAPVNGAIIEGNVGIGTATPHALLQLGNTITNRKIVLYETINNDHEYLGFGINGGMLRYQVANVNDNHVFFSGINATSSKELMRITGSGFVGIGTKAPSFPLTVRTSNNTEEANVASLATAIADTMFQLNVTRGSNTNGVGSWMTAIGQSYNGGALTEAIKFLRGAYTDDGAIAFNTKYVERMRITSSGAIGIGITNPQGPLHVAAIGMTAPAQDRNYFNVSTGPNLIFNNSASGNVQIIADGYFWANGGGFVATSDQRIKIIKGLTDTKQDLATLNAIEVTDYTYIDSIQNGNTPQKKVIAQQLQRVFPQAVNTNAGIIPNVFEVASSREVIDQHTIITTSKAHEFVDGDQVRLILEGKGEKVLKVDVIDTMTFRVEEALSGRIFVYGKHVEDLLNVDYDAVAMLNVSATQELYKMILELKAENEQLRQNLEDRLTKVEAVQKGGIVRSE